MAQRSQKLIGDNKKFQMFRKQKAHVAAWFIHLGAGWITSMLTVCGSSELSFCLKYNRLEPFFEWY